MAGFGLATEAAILASLLLSGALAAPPSLAEPPAGSARRSRDALVVLTVEHPGEGAVVQRALADAELLRQAVVVSLGVSTRRVSVLADPTRDVVDKELARAIGRVRSRGVLWVVVLGRGSSTALELADGSLALQEIADLGLATRADQVVMLADVRTDGGDRADPEALRPVAAPAWVKGDPRLVWWGADDAGVPAIWSAAGHGVFPWLVAGALRGWADGALGEPDGAVTLTEAMQYVATTTPALGYLQRSSVDARPEVAALVISEGPIEASPTAASLAEWATADRADRLAAASARATSASASAFAAAVDAARAAGGEVAPLEAFVAEHDRAEVVLRFALPVEQLAEARALIADPSALQSAPAVAEAAPAVEDDGCADLLMLEAPALAGALSPERIACMEAAYAEESITGRDKLSRLLMVNAKAAGDTAAWEGHIRRHLDEIDRSDPDMCLALALHLAREGAQEDAITWADMALENKLRWQGKAFTDGLSVIYQLKAESAYYRWLEAKDQFVLEPTKAVGSVMERWRGAAKNYAREWLDYAEASGADMTKARELCLSSAGSSTFCLGG